MVKRWAINIAQGSKVEHKFGSYVDHSEYEKLEAKLEAVRKRSEVWKSEASEWDGYGCWQDVHLTCYENEAIKGEGHESK